MSDGGIDIYSSLVCKTDFLVVGFARYEKGACLVRFVCTMFTVSIISSWCNKRNVVRLLLFFSHWLSGFVHQMAEVVLSVWVLLCWAKNEDHNFLKAMKFFELLGANMLAVTNLAICINLALIVSSHRTMSRVKSVASPKLILLFFSISVAATVAVVPFWETVVFTGTIMWSQNSDPRKQAWVMTGLFLMELITGFAMTVVVALLLVFRRPELRQVWQLHNRIKFYFALTVIAIMVDLTIGIGGLIYITNERFSSIAITTSWAMRHVHIALDTLVLYSALGVTSSKMDIAPSSSTGEDSVALQNRRLNLGSKSMRRGYRYGIGRHNAVRGRVLYVPRISASTSNV